MPDRIPDPEPALTLTAKDTLERANAELRAEVERLTARLEGATERVHRERLATLAAASERERALRACLTDLQWSGGQDRHGCGICPDCYQTSSDGHTSRCALLALLAPGTESPCPGCRAGLAICPHHRPAHHVSQHNQSCQRCVAPAADWNGPHDASGDDGTLDSPNNPLIRPPSELSSC